MLKKRSKKMLTISRGNVMIQLPCGCNSSKVEINPGDVEAQKENDIYLETFVEDHDEICWNKN